MPENELDKVISDLSKDIVVNNERGIEDNLQSLETSPSKKKVKQLLCKFRIKKDGTESDLSLLHIATTYHQNEAVIGRLLDLSPKLLLLPRKKNYKGQTSFHIAVARGNVDICRKMLDKEKQYKPDPKTKIVDQLADGLRFNRTVMMGQSPLSLAALKCRFDMIDLLLEYGANICQTNTEGDTIFHTLIKFSALCPEKETELLEIFVYLSEKLKQTESKQYHCDNEYENTKQERTRYLSERSYIWFQTNNNKLNPLQLAAKCGVVPIFEYIINMEDVYCFMSTQDGLFDIKMYDITNIDTVANQRAMKVDKKVLRENEVSAANYEDASLSTKDSSDRSIYPETESILEMMVSQKLDYDSIFRIIELTPVRNIIRAKWRRYKTLHRAWMVIHVILLILLTVHSVLRAELQYSSRREYSVPAHVINGIGVSLALFYLFISVVVLLAKYKKPTTSNNKRVKYMHHLSYLAFLLVFSVCCIIDVILYYATDSVDNSGFLITALIMGWWFTIFFLSAMKHFSFFTVLIRRVIFGDLLIFSVIISLELISFTAGMYIMFAGRTVQGDTGSDVLVPDDNFSGYFPTMLTMFKLMLGLSEIDILYEARSPGIAITLFILFVLFTYVLMINALIAMMSQTCAMVSEDRYTLRRIQKLSIILFIEEIISLPCCNKYLQCPDQEFSITKYSPISKNDESEIRFLFEIHSSQKDSDIASEDDKQTIRRHDTRVSNQENSYSFSPLRLTRSLLQCGLKSNFEETQVKTYHTRKKYKATRNNHTQISPSDESCLYPIYTLDVHHFNNM